ncbi:fibrinogen-like protein A [Rhopilema esculentum]|uniref:fibrinogen-like protein A n=1 Tax=Rhopilema esculentum TaxID=499914 RepID=UPI0031DD4453
MKEAFTTCQTLFVLLMTSRCLCLTRLPCKFYADFSIILNNTADTGTVMKTISSRTVRQCTLECLSWPKCLSLNYNRGTMTCELLERRFNESVPLLTERKGQVYMTTDDGKINNGPVCQIKSPCENGAKCKDTCDEKGYKCICAPLYYGTHCDKLKQDCGDVRKSGETVSGVYEIKPDHNWKANVFCDFVYGSQDWIVFQRRIDASVDFYRNWASYKNGFGDTNGNFWIGLDTLHRLAAPGRGAILRIDMKHHNSPTTQYYAEYSSFEVGDEASGYKLLSRGYSGNAGDSMAFHDGMKFTTYDRDNDKSRENCANNFKGAWWYKSCQHASLNGLFPTTSTTSPTYMGWLGIDGKHGNVMFSEMKLKYHRGTR